ncbi:glycoside hydrolase domain-containing protein [Flagellimonas okinawensis]|uniref:Glycoside hydrolase family 92 protein n=1 Tax=Flagellimonas okinawensis TaxID=3031324 RepID=A0ABT5XU03_9FLAO|nr:glycoside hydrolase domain-containing protein [[Muricauda] okinawensis]MDF0709031.1 glycoside hydrolase family 92 protein [[Muricauda] okinawensis]
MKEHIGILLVVLLFMGCREDQVNQDLPLAKSASGQVNVFLGTSGDHGQMSPSASSPFNMISIGPVTRPGTHTGYDHYAKEFLGFVHTHIEGVGCRGGGGNILVRPMGSGGPEEKLWKARESAQPGYYQVAFVNGIRAEMAVGHNYGVHQYQFPGSEKYLTVDVAHAFLNRFVDARHRLAGNAVRGWVDTRTVCDRGMYRLYFYMEFDHATSVTKTEGNTYLIKGSEHPTMGLRIGFSSVSEEFAKARLTDGGSLERTMEKTTAAWDTLLDQVKVNGEEDRTALFYSLLYRSLQSPYVVSEPDGSYRAIDGSLQRSKGPIYHGWAIWDNYREQMPLLSLLFPKKYGDMARSIANLYPYGKNDWSTMHAPSNSVRTEHAQVVLLDALEKGHHLPLEDIRDSLVQEMDSLDFGSPDKALESSYDLWAGSKLMRSIGDTLLADTYLKRALGYRTYWERDFADMDWPDVDRMGARGLYQGTLWQYRWFVPFDIEGLQDIAGGEQVFREQLDRFFEGNNYNHANQPDLQVPGLYNTTKEPWKTQKLYRALMLDTVVQTYFNNNSKGIDPYIGRIYNNRPRAYLKTMDDDMGTMSSWFVLRSMGLSAVNVGEPRYYLTAPIFKEVELHGSSKKSLKIKVSNYHKDHYYIRSVRFNGKPLLRNWLTHSELIHGGELIMETDSVPNLAWGTQNQYLAHPDMKKD